MKKTYNDFWAEKLLIHAKQALEGEEKISLADVYRKEARFMKEVLSLSAGQRVLDLGSGAGEHCLALGEEGIKAVGVEIAPVLVEYANQKAATAGVEARYVSADMRTYRSETPFDAVFTSSGTFGLLDDASNLLVIKTIRDGLKKGGKFLIGPSGPDLLDRGSYREKDWLLMDDGCLLRERVWDQSTSTFHEIPIFMDSKGTLVEFVGGFDGRTDGEGISSPVYSMDQITKMLEDAGLLVEAKYGSYELPPKPYRQGKRLLLLGHRNSEQGQTRS